MHLAFSAKASAQRVAVGKVTDVSAVKINLHLRSINELKHPESLAVGEEALSKLLAGKVYDYL